MEVDDIIKLMEYQKEKRDDELVEILERISGQLTDLYGYLRFMTQGMNSQDLPF